MRRAWVATAPLDLRQVLGPLRRGPFDPTMRWELRGGAETTSASVIGVWRTMRTPAGTATLHLSRGVGCRFEAVAWGSGADWALDTMPELLGSGDDWSALDLSAAPLLAEVARRFPGLRLTRTNQVFEMLLAAIVEQKVTTKEAHSSWATLLRRYGEPAPGPAPEGMRVFPAAHTWRRIPSWEWHRAGVDPQRSRTALAAAAVADSLERTLAAGRSGDGVAKKLRSLPGVGVWTAAETTQRAHGDPDAVSVGDYHLASWVGWALLGRPVDDAGMLELLEPWAGQRQRILQLLSASGFRKPRFGPRLTIQDHRGH